MVKVSNTMLAVVAALQSGAHTRRKPKYISEKALVSGLYGFSFIEKPLIANVSLEGLALDEVVVFAGVEEEYSSLVINTTLEGLSLSEPVISLVSKDDGAISGNSSLELLELKSVVISLEPSKEDGYASASSEFSDIKLDRVVVSTTVYDDGRVVGDSVLTDLVLENV